MHFPLCVCVCVRVCVWSKLSKVCGDMARACMQASEARWRARLGAARVCAASSVHCAAARTARAARAAVAKCWRPGTAAAVGSAGAHEGQPSQLASMAGSVSSAASASSTRPLLGADVEMSASVTGEAAGAGRRSSRAGGRTAQAMLRRVKSGARALAPSFRRVGKGDIGREASLACQEGWNILPVKTT